MAREVETCYHGGFGWRYIVCLLMFVIVVVCYADRTNIGIVLAQDEFAAIGPNDKGTVLSAFFVGYMFTQIPGGHLARTRGAKKTLLLAAVVWTVFDVLTPFAARLGLVPLIIARIGMGLGEGMTFPAQHALTSFWVPTHERAFLTMFMTSGQDMGSVLANTVSPHLIEINAWLVFVCWGSLAFLWCIVFTGLGGSAPEVHGPCCRSGEAAWIQAHRQAGPFEDARRAREAMVPRRLLRQPCVWGIFIGHIGANYAWYVMLSWMPSYFEGVFGLRLADNTLTLAGPYIGCWLGSLTSGKLGDVLVSRGFRTRHVRKLLQVTGALLSTAAFQLAAYSTTHGVAAVWVSIALAFGRFQAAGYWVNMIDICPLSAASIMGMSNTIATIPGIVGQPLTQAILDWAGGAHSERAWSIVFGVGGVVSICAAAAFTALADDVNLDRPPTEGEEHMDSNLIPARA
uniref:Major facilitator superfamily (MFS) profile domain-containing protein n=1 Tax=Alexandrium monilatum TaxID=311494 RepID=A0A7S4VIC2_9DINO|mmetsp:Transcript_86855/g.274194  ORF Transcript_86855/g.274194 Transcript_86855/m.274194 type:complete len:457 (-) Transcript_86855:82-1452(-)